MLLPLLLKEQYSAYEYTFRFSTFYVMDKICLCILYRNKTCQTLLLCFICGTILHHSLNFYHYSCKKFNRIPPDIKSSSVLNLLQPCAVQKVCQKRIFHLNNASTMSISCQQPTTREDKSTVIFAPRLNVLTKPPRLHAKHGQPSFSLQPIQVYIYIHKKKMPDLDPVHPAPGFCSLPCMKKKTPLSSICKGTAFKISVQCWHLHTKPVDLILKLRDVASEQGATCRLTLEQAILGRRSFYLVVKFSQTTANK